MPFWTYGTYESYFKYIIYIHSNVLMHMKRSSLMLQLKREQTRKNIPKLPGSCGTTNILKNCKESKIMIQLRIEEVLP
jgi:hypothetical protein